jgi:hypothetical protein
MFVFTTLSGLQISYEGSSSDFAIPSCIVPNSSHSAYVCLLIDMGWQYTDLVSPCWNGLSPVYLEYAVALLQDLSIPVENYFDSFPVFSPEDLFEQPLLLKDWFDDVKRKLVLAGSEAHFHSLEEGFSPRAKTAFLLLLLALD